jgi:hypothetical protein
MRLIRQLKPYDCGIAVTAMIANVNYEAVLDQLITGLSSENPINPLAMWRALETLTPFRWYISELRPPWPRVICFKFSESPGALMIQRANSSRHYIAAIGPLVYDPLFDAPFSQDEYPDRDAFVVTTLRSVPQG